MNDFSDNIKKYRKKNNLSQADLAEKLYLTSQAISKWERGVSEPDLKFLCKLARIFNVTTDELLGMYDTDKPGNFMIGIDGGGTKTEMILFSSDGKIINRVMLDGSNPNSCSIEATFLTLKKGINTLMISENRHIVGIYAGIAGCGSGDNAVKLSEMLEKEYPNINIKITSDIENVTGGVGDVSDCIAVICGTGNIVCAKKNNLYHRLGGWGYLFDDAGSGYTIGRDAICAALAEKEGIGEKTILTNLVERKINGEILGKINEIYSKGVGYIASFSEYVFEAYSKKDRVAERILNKNFSHIANLINHAYKEYNCNATVVFSGGIAKNKEIVEIFLQDKIDAKIKVIFPDMPQVYGACRNCCSSFSTLGKSFKENFKNDYNKIIKRKGR